MIASSPAPFWAIWLIHRVLHQREGRLQLRSEALDRRDGRDRNAHREQAAFDGGRAGLVAEEFDQLSLHRAAPLHAR